MKFMGMLVVLAAVGLAGCTADVEDGENADSDVYDMESPSLSEQAFAPDGINYTCVPDLSLRSTAGGTIVAILPYRTTVYAKAQYKTVNGTTWVYGQVKSGVHSGKWGWISRKYLDQFC